MDLTIIASVCGGGLAGSLLTTFVNYLRGKIQVMECHFIVDDILSKIPITNEDNTIHSNIYCKTFRIKNTTNKDIENFQVVFQFDSTADIIECYSRSKEGYNKQKVKKSKDNNNEARAYIKQMNRNDTIEFTFRIANVTDDKYYISESNCLGFKIKCKDKIKHHKSNQSNELLINRPSYLKS